jgi:cysteine desulfurase
MIGDGWFPRMVSRVYLDHNATTPPDPEVVDAVARTFRLDFGNPSSIHAFGQRAKALLDEARSAVARLLGADPDGLVFTSGGTEADNIALRGVMDAAASTERTRLVVSAVEHEAVLNTARALSRRGCPVTVAPVDRDGVLAPDALAPLLADDVALVSVMAANNETGVRQDVGGLAALAHRHGALFHTDAVQTAAKVPFDVAALDADLVSVAAHKFGGPPGVGALWVRGGTTLLSPVTGGRQERSRRAGTENVPAIVGFGVAAVLGRARLEAFGVRVAALRDRLERGILGEVPDTVVNGAGAPRLPTTSNIAFDGIEAESLLIALDLEGIAVSTGSACSSGALEPSHVLRAMGLPPRRVQGSIRFSLGESTTDAEIDRVLGVVPGLARRLRAAGVGRR